MLDVWYYCQKWWTFLKHDIYSCVLNISALERYFCLILRDDKQGKNHFELIKIREKTSHYSTIRIGKLLLFIFNLHNESFTPRKLYWNKISLEPHCLLYNSNLINMLKIRCIIIQQRYPTELISKAVTANLIFSPFFMCVCVSLMVHAAQRTL